MPARDLRSPASCDGTTSSRSAVMRIECLSRRGPSAMRREVMRTEARTADSAARPPSRPGSLRRAWRPSARDPRRGSSPLAVSACSLLRRAAATTTAAAAAAKTVDRSPTARSRSRRVDTDVRRQDDQHRRRARSRSRSSKKGNLEHTFVVEDAEGEARSEARGERRPRPTPGRSTSRPATYEFYCDIPGHRGQGMEGTIVVT